MTLTAGNCRLVSVDPFVHLSNCHLLLPGANNRLDLLMSFLSGRIDTTHPSKERRLCLKESAVCQMMSSSSRIQEKLRSSETFNQICRELNARLGDGHGDDDQPACCLQDLESFLDAVLHVDNKLGLILDKAVSRKLAGMCLYIHVCVCVCVCVYVRQHSTFLSHGIEFKRNVKLEFQEAGRGIGYIAAYGHRDKDLIARAIQAWPASMPHALKTLCISLRKMQSDNDAVFRSKFISLLTKDEV